MRSGPFSREFRYASSTIAFRFARSVGMIVARAINMNKKHYDLIVIGTGPAGGTIASTIAKAGRSVALVDSREFGGTCALRGCNPKKVYANAAAIADQARRSDGRLTNLSGIRLDWSLLLDTKRSFTQPVIETKRDDFEEMGIDTVQGIATFTSRDSIMVGDRSLSAERLVVATGSRPTELGIEGEALAIDSDNFFELQRIPSHVTFIGGGYIAMEFAHVVARHGSQVTIVENSSQPLKGFDPDLVSQLVERSSEVGIEIITNANVSRISNDGDEAFTVNYSHDRKQQNLKTNLVISTAGRTPNINELCLADAEVQADDDGIAINACQQSVSNPNVFAAGDCVNSELPSLTSVAKLQAETVIGNLFREDRLIETPTPPIAKAVFTSPCIAQVGLTEESAIEKKHQLKVFKDDSSTWGTVRKTAIDCAGYKIIVDEQTDKILGAHLIGPSAEEIIGLFTLAMTHGLTANQLKETQFAYPTFSSDVSRMLTK